MPDIQTVTGTVYHEVDGYPWIGKYHSFEGMIWAGACARLDAGTVEDGDMTVHTRQNARGGLERDPNVRVGTPGEASGSLIIKLVQSNRMREILRKCLWILDKRFGCEGRDRDAFNAWETIVRVCPTNFGRREITGTNLEDPGVEAMVTHGYVGLNELDIFRVSSEFGEVEFYEGGGLTASINDVATCQPDGCGGRCDTQEDCVVVAVTEPDGVYSDPWLLINLAGGALNQWTGQQLTEWSLGADAVHCAGEFLIIVSEGERAILRSDDRGTTRVEIDGVTGVTDWASHAPLDVDFIDQTYILITGKDGYIWVSRDAGRTFSRVSAGDATTQDLTKVQIARDNPLVAYAIGPSNAIVKTENGGQTWYPLTGPSAADALIALWVKNQSDVMVVNDDGEIWVTEDGGASWTQHAEPAAGFNTTLTFADIAGCGCGVVFMVATDGTNHFVLRNVEGGASGKWFTPAGEVPNDDPIAIACCDANRAVVVGGDGTTAEVVGLLA